MNLIVIGSLLEQADAQVVFALALGYHAQSVSLQLCNLVAEASSTDGSRAKHSSIGLVKVSAKGSLGEDLCERFPVRACAGPYCE